MYDEYRRRKLPGKPFMSSRITQVYPTGVCIYFYFGFYYKGIPNPQEVYLELENIARDEILKSGGSLSTSPRSRQAASRFSSADHVRNRASMEARAEEEPGSHERFRRRKSGSRYSMSAAGKTAAWVVITGASSGIGKALAYEFAAGGFNLMLVGRNEAALRPGRCRLLR